MKRSLLFIFILSLAIPVCSHAHSVTDSAKSLLWRISSKEMKKPSYLFGTMHLICPEDYIWTETMKKCLRASDEVCFEMDMDDPSLLMDIASGMVNYDGKALKEYFSDSDYHKVARYIADSLHMDIAQFRQMKPAALQTILSIRSVDCDAPVSYENNIMDEAKKLKKEIIGLEEAREQLSLLDNLPADSIIAGLISLIDSNAPEKATYKKLAVLYKKQDLPALYQLILQSKEQGDNMDAFLDERNQRWISRIVEKMDQCSVFFAVGAGHLWGENGLITLLRKEGYTVKPVR